MYASLMRFQYGGYKVGGGGDSSELEDGDMDEGDEEEGDAEDGNGGDEDDDDGMVACGANAWLHSHTLVCCNVVEEDQFVAGADEPELFGTHLLLESQDVDGRAIMEGAGMSARISMSVCVPYCRLNANLRSAREAQTAQPTGTTLATSNVRTPLPKLLRGPPLREYQHIGLDWLVAMYEKGLNGILVRFQKRRRVSSR